MKKGIKVKGYIGIYYDEIANGDKSYYYTLKISPSKVDWVYIGKHSEGIRPEYVFQLRIKHKNSVKFGDEDAQHLARRNGLKKGIVTFDDIASRYFNDKQLTNLNIKKDTQNYEKRLKSFLGKEDVVNLTPAHFEKLQLVLKNDGLSNKTINNLTNLCKAMLNNAIKKDYIKRDNPLTKITLLPVDNIIERVLNIREVKSLLKEVDDNPYLKLYCLIGLYTGARPDAIISLRKKDVDIENRTIVFKAMKKRPSYSIPIADNELLDTIAKRLDEIELNDYVVSKKCSQTPYQTFYDNIQPILDKLFNEGLDKKEDTKHLVTPYTLRHSFATFLATKKINPIVIQTLMNHSDLKTTRRYIKTDLEAVREDLKNLVG